MKVTGVKDGISKGLSSRYWGQAESCLDSLHTVTQYLSADWQCTLIPAPGRQAQADLCELEDSLIYIVNSRPVKTTVRPSMKTQTTITTKAAALGLCLALRDPIFQAAFDSVLGANTQAG